MNPNQSGDQPFSTSEKILVFCLNLAGCEVIGITNYFDQEILFTYGGGRRDPNTKEVTRPSRFRDLKPWDAAQIMWKEGGQGHVEYQFALTKDCQDLIKAYRDQRDKMEKVAKKDEKGSDAALKIMELAAKGAMLPPEAILRLACLAVKLRPEFLNLWQGVVPTLFLPVEGKTKQFETTATFAGKDGPKTVQAKGVKRPGYKFCSLNASMELRKKMGFA